MWTDRSHGDVSGVVGDGERRPVPVGGDQGLLLRRTYRVRQVHGPSVCVVAGGVVVGGTGHGAARSGDALVTADPAACLAVVTADCASVALASPEGAFGAVHAGWRGLLAGVVERAAEAMERLGASRIEGLLGPCVHPECYEFAEAGIDTVAAVYGDVVRGRSAAGTPALDLPAGVRAAMARAGVIELPGDDRCTACGTDFFSHRAGGDRARQGLFVWRDEDAG
ncbi:MAG: laccase domain-containing protein [Actinomycetota bacterium]|nr:laccase domain-containing protein [Actinomycetota bacterium]